MTVEMTRYGCDRCGGGRQWCVVGPDDVALGVTFELKEQAEELAEHMNTAYWAGHGAADADLLVALKDIDVMLDAITMSTENGVELIGPTRGEVLWSAAAIKAAIAKAERQ